MGRQIFFFSLLEKASPVSDRDFKYWQVLHILELRHYLKLDFTVEAPYKCSTPEDYYSPKKAIWNHFSRHFARTCIREADPKNLHFIIQSVQSRTEWNEISTSYLQTNLKRRPVAVTADKMEKDTFFTGNTSTAARTTEGSQQQQNPILVHLGMNDTPTNNAY